MVERIVADAGAEPGVLPLMQETLVLLWEDLERRFLPLRAYDALAKDEQRTGLQVALARQADSALAQLPGDQQVLAGRIFVRLVQFGEGRADTRRQQSLAQLRTAGDDPGIVDGTVYYLAERRLLTPPGDAEKGRLVDPWHETLITGWPALHDCIRVEGARDGRAGVLAGRKETTRKLHRDAHESFRRFLVSCRIDPASDTWSALPPNVLAAFYRWCLDHPCGGLSSLQCSMHLRLAFGVNTQ